MDTNNAIPEFQGIQKLKETYYSIILKIGAIQYKIYSMELQLDTLKNELNSYYEEISKLNDAESEILKNIESKYGPGKLDLNTGVFNKTN